VSESIRDFFSTDWGSMTHVDWTGLAIVLLLTALMIGLYVWTFRPSNRDKFEQHRDFVNQDKDIEEEIRREVEHGKAR